MKKNAFLTAAVAALFLLTIGINTGFAKKDDTDDTAKTEHNMDHDQITSGADFGEHVSGHAKSKGGFSGDHNPGKMHQGYSGIKKDND